MTEQSRNPRSFPLYKATSPPSQTPTGSLKYDFVLFFRRRVAGAQELADNQEILEQSKNEGLVIALYEAIRSRDVQTVHQILAPDLEWWFHGPPRYQFLMRLLTGSGTTSDKEEQSSFEFVPLSITSFGPTVLAEGCDCDGKISWIHAWTVADGIITQVREYFNTSLTVTRFGNSDPRPSVAEIVPSHCPSVWESTLSSRVGKSVPGLVLAI